MAKPCYLNYDWQNTTGEKDLSSRFVLDCGSDVVYRS